MRIPPPLVMLSSVGLIWLSTKFAPALGFALPFGLEKYRWFIGGFLIFEGLVLEASSIFGFFRKRTTITPLAIEKASSLITGGFYRFTRNPMYLGMVAMIGGAGLILANLTVIFAVIAFVFYITKKQIKPEERALARNFGQEYESYKKKVRRWI